jgi:hypothetical protein
LLAAVAGKFHYSKSTSSYCPLLVSCTRMEGIVVFDNTANDGWDWRESWKSGVGAAQHLLDEIGRW